MSGRTVIVSVSLLCFSFSTRPGCMVMYGLFPCGSRFTLATSNVSRQRGSLLWLFAVIPLAATTIVDASIHTALIQPSFTLDALVRGAEPQRSFAIPFPRRILAMAAL